MAKNVMTKFEIFTDQDGICLTGRLLGLIKEEDLFPLLNNKTFQRKIFSKGTLSVSEVAEAIDNKDKDIDIRLVVVVRELSGETVSQKTLFISDKLDFVSKLVSPTEMAVNGQNDCYIFIEEIKNDEV